MQYLIPFLAVIIGYLLGSVSPSYILGRLLKKVDIREVGDKNAGASNTYHVLGLWPAVITAIYDLGKGLLAMYLAWLLGVSLFFIYLAGAAAVVGHIAPFYLGFRGGQGAATCTGLLFYLLYVLLKKQFLPISSISILAATVAIILLITRRKQFLALIILPSLSFMLIKNYRFDLSIIFAQVIIVYLFALNVYLSWKRKIFDLKEKTREQILPWRSVMRPLASVFPIAYFYVDKKILLWIVGIIAGIFFLVDLVRLLSRHVHLFFMTKATRVYKKGEEKRFSSMSLFLIAAFAVILLFPKSIAICALFFLIFGDLFAKFFGLEYGKLKIFGDKTLEGSLGHFMACLLAGYILYPYLDLSAWVILIGMTTATIVEALPLNINDNFTVSLFSASAMYLVQRFFV